MKYTKNHSSLQRTPLYSKKLPPFLRPDTPQVSVSANNIFPRDTVFLFSGEGWNDCSCHIRGFLFLWRLFFALYHHSKNPNGPLPEQFQRGHSMDLLKFRGHTWMYAFYNFSCQDCYPVMKKLITSVTEAFLPTQHLIDFSRLEARVCIFWDTHLRASLELTRKFELGMAIPASLLSMILSGVRDITFRLKHSLGEELGSDSLRPVFQQLCDVVGGDLFEGEFSLSFLSTDHRPCKLLVHRDQIHVALSQPNGAVRFIQLYWDEGWGPHDNSWQPSRRQPQRRRWVKPSQPQGRASPSWTKPDAAPPSESVNQFGFPRHSPCSSRFPTVSGSLRTHVADCCKAALRRKYATQSLAAPPSEQLAVNLNRQIQQSLSTPASPLQQHSHHRRRGPARASKSPRTTGSQPVSRQGPRTAAVDFRRQLPHRLPNQNAGQVSPPARVAPDVVRDRQFLLRVVKFCFFVVHSA